ncbi:T9SS type A sorting domain-containing protein [Hymenobacter ruricola]|uniref:T9SS type A sorting domain-containing protein n=1 Tax=Hymenobacter ruricola TaxID=2791023 RepID=A0ABS0HYQ0_9BACT|nr:T9SS type A sorting domain-containing protein [Hymenobacter ruricola]MBF9219837.1 T9SS type A sorting domain-containing protein [Hymenobacter ruricola]
MSAWSPPAQAQLWQLTPTFPGGPKTGVAATGDSTLLTAVAAGLLRTTNRGRTWQLARRTGPVFAVFATRQGHLLAGGAGKVYRSFDAGATWDSVALATPHPVAAFAETPQGALLVGTGEYIAVNGAGSSTGNGVFCSVDQGQTWQARNTGIGAGRFVDRLATDRLGRVYAAVADQQGASQPGLYLSTNEGLSWQYLPVRLNAAGFTDPVTMYEVTALAVSPQDSLQCSYQGVYQNFEASGNLAQSLTNVTNPLAGWTVHGGTSGISWWARAPLANLHFAQNGDWYSSRPGPPTVGGTLVSQNRGRSWRLERAGLGAGADGFRQAQQFAEFADGDVFMVQDTDVRVYHTGRRLASATAPQQATDFQLYPNPTADAVQLVNRTGQRIVALALYDLSGRCLQMVTPTASAIIISLAKEKPGIYLVSATLADGRVVRRRVVKQ